MVMGLERRALSFEVEAEEMKSRLHTTAADTREASRAFFAMFRSWIIIWNIKCAEIKKETLCADGFCNFVLESVHKLGFIIEMTR
jgi:hypothetical protein